MFINFVYVQEFGFQFFVQKLIQNKTFLFKSKYLKKILILRPFVVLIVAVNEVVEDLRTKKNRSSEVLPCCCDVF